MFWRRRRSFGRILATASLAVFIFFTLYVTSANELEYQVDSIELTVHRDGSVHVTQILTIDETFPSVSFPSLASEVENVLVVDENWTLLKYEMDGSRFTVFSLGAKKAVLEYDSVFLTEKEAGVWTLVLHSPYNLTVCLAQGSAITYLSDLPTSIETDDGEIILSLFPGDWKISYLLRMPVPAAFIVSDLTVTPTEIGVGDQVTISVKVTNIGEAEGSHDVSLEIDGAVEKTKSVVLAGRESYTMEFRVVTEDPGIHSIKVGELTSEFSVANPPIPTDYLTVVGVAVFAFSIGGFIFLKRRPDSAKRIFRDLSDLRQEDREVIEFIAQRGGKVIEGEIRESFPDLPRTSVWRLVRRLERMEIISITKVGKVNQIELRK
jgi:uncharacterized membrane protein